MKTFLLFCFLLPAFAGRTQPAGDTICLEMPFNFGYYQLCGTQIQVKKNTILMQTNVPVIPGDSITSYRYIWYYTDNQLNGLRNPESVPENALLLKFATHDLQVNGTDFTGTIRIAQRKVFRGVENVHSVYAIREYHYADGKLVQNGWVEDIRLNPVSFEMY